MSQQRCKDCKYCLDDLVPVLNELGQAVASGLADCILSNKLVILSDEACSEFKFQSKEDESHGKRADKRGNDSVDSGKI